MQRILRFERQQGVDIEGFSEILNRSVTLRLLTSAIFAAEQPDVHSLNNWVSLANTMGYDSRLLQKHFKLASDLTRMMETGSENPDDRLTQLRETGVQLLSERANSREPLSHLDKRSPAYGRLNEQIQKNFEQRMDLIEIFIEQIYRRWEEEILAAESSRITVNEQHGINSLISITERMKSDADRILILQREQRLLEIALAAERGQLAPTRRYLLVPNSKTGHLSRTWVENPYRFSNPLELADGVSIHTVGAVDSDNVLAALESTGKLPGQNHSFIFDSGANPDNPTGMANYSLLDGNVTFFDMAESQSVKNIARSSRHEIGHGIYREYFTSLPDVVQKAIHNVYISWLNDKRTLRDLGVSAISAMDLEKLDLYAHSFSEMFAEMRALYEYSKSGAGRNMNYTKLLKAVTGNNDRPRVKIMKNAASLYAILKEQVFEPYDQGPPRDRKEEG